MSLAQRVNHPSEYIDEDPGYISEAAMEGMYVSILSETLNTEEMEDFVSESANYEGVIEAQKNIVKLNKEAKLQRAYKTAILQCASEDGRKEYKKLRTLWKMEAALFKKLERIYKNKAMARAKKAVKELAKKKKTGPVNVAAARASKAIDKKLLGGTNNLLNSGIRKAK
jgi:hypothetical protein